MSEQLPPERPSRKNGRIPPNGGGMRVGRGLFGWVLFIGLAIMLFMLLQQNKHNYQTIQMSEFENYLSSNEVKSITIDGDEVSGEFVKAMSVPSVPNQQVKEFRVTYP